MTEPIPQSRTLPLFSAHYLATLPDLNAASELGDSSLKLDQNGYRYWLAKTAGARRVYVESWSDLEARWVEQGYYDGDDANARMTYTNEGVRQVYEQGRQAGRRRTDVLTPEQLQQPWTIYGEGFIDGYRETHDDQCDCSNRGWFIMATNGDDSRDWIERCDDCKKFETDDDAAKAASIETGRAVKWAGPFGTESYRPYLVATSDTDVSDPAGDQADYLTAQHENGFHVKEIQDGCRECSEDDFACESCGNPVMLERREAGGTIAWAERRPGTFLRNWDDDRDFQCGISDEGFHLPEGFAHP